MFPYVAGQGFVFLPSKGGHPPSPHFRPHAKLGYTRKYFGKTERGDRSFVSRITQGSPLQEVIHSSQEKDCFTAQCFAQRELKPSPSHTNHLHFH